MVWDQELDPGKCSPDPCSGKNTVWRQPLAVSYFRSVSAYLWYCGILRTVYPVSAWNDSMTAYILMASVCCWALLWTDGHLLILNQGLCFFLSQACLSNRSSIRVSPHWPYQHSKTRRVIQDKEVRWGLGFLITNHSNDNRDIVPGKKWGPVSSQNGLLALLLRPLPAVALRDGLIVPLFKYLQMRENNW